MLTVALRVKLEYYTSPQLKLEGGGLKIVSCRIDRDNRAIFIQEVNLYDLHGDSRDHSDLVTYTTHHRETRYREEIVK